MRYYPAYSLLRTHAHTPRYSSEDSNTLQMSVAHQGDSPAVADAIMEAARKYPLPEFPGERRHPNTGWMIIDLVAVSPSSPERYITRTFQARELINDGISVHLSALRTHSFFTEVHKLLVFCKRLGNLNMLDWDDEVLNELVCGLADQDTGILASTDNHGLWEVQDTLECEDVVELFERATKKGLEKLTIYVAWYDSSLSQEFSLLRKHFRHKSLQVNRLESCLETRYEPRQESQPGSPQVSSQESDQGSRSTRVLKASTGNKIVNH